MEIDGYGRERLVRHHALQGKPLLAHCTDDCVLASLDRLISTFTGEPRLDLALRPSRRNEAQPVAAWASALRLRCEDLDDVAIGECRLERHQLAVHACSDTAMPNFCVHRVGKVNRRGSRGQGHDVSLGREDEYLG